MNFFFFWLKVKKIYTFSMLSFSYSKFRNDVMKSSVKRQKELDDEPSTFLFFSTFPLLRTFCAISRFCKKGQKMDEAKMQSFSHQIKKMEGVFKKREFTKGENVFFSFFYSSLHFSFRPDKPRKSKARTKRKETIERK